MTGDPEQNVGKDAEVIVVLGCRVHDGEPQGALLRRLLRARAVHQRFPHLPLIMSGGKAWQGVREAEAMARWWIHEHQDPCQPHVDLDSTTTKENAYWVGQICERLGYRHIVLVTCDFHMPRARALFVEQGLVVTEACAHHQRTLLASAKLLLREWGARALGPFEHWRQGRGRGAQ